MKCCMIISVMSLILSLLHARGGGGRRVGFTPIKGELGYKAASLPRGASESWSDQVVLGRGHGKAPPLPPPARHHFDSHPSPIFYPPTPISCLPASDLPSPGWEQEGVLRMMDGKGRRERWS